MHEDKIEKFIGFSKLFLDNYCQECIKNKFINNIVINFDNMKIDDILIEKLYKKKNFYKNSLLDESSFINTNIIIDNYNGYYEILSEEDKEFFEFINIIIEDFKNYPNFSHFFNKKIY